MSKIDLYYLFEETYDTAATITSSKHDFHEIKEFLKVVHQIPADQIELALAITANTPGVPYDLYKPDGVGDSFGWTARLTLKVRYRG